MEVRHASTLRPRRAEGNAEDASHPGGRYGRAAPDLVVVDLASKPSAGLTAVKRVRARRPLAAIVAVTAPAAKRPASFERSVHVRALDAGADDVFALGSERDPVLVARLRAHARRGALARVLRTDRTPRGVRVDPRLGVALVDGRRLVPSETPMELAILRCLASRTGRSVGRRELVRAVWGPDHRVEAAAFRQHIARLRHKLGSAAVMLETLDEGWRLRRPRDEGGPKETKSASALRRGRELRMPSPRRNAEDEGDSPARARPKAEGEHERDAAA